MKEVVEEYGMVVVYCITMAMLTKAFPVLINTFEATNTMFLIGIGG